ncbi:hypothetical protein OB920_06955 [Halobacteria archaeon HArc-gm2]|nr:hypothetical protein [Halobacteria archaeon HArc-gm2]
MQTIVAGTQIDAPRADVFAFFERMNDRRYRAWHPEAHRDFRYVSGDRIETGTVAHFEEVVGGDHHSFDAEYAAVVPDRLIEFRLTHPVWRLFLPTVRLEFRDSGRGSHFVQKLFLRSGPVSAHSARVQDELATVHQHVVEEGEYLRDVVENDRIDAIDAGSDPAAVGGPSAQRLNVQTP